MLKMRRGSAACPQTQQGATARTSEVADCGPDSVRLCAQHVGNLSVVVLGLLRWLELRRQDETLSSLHRRDIGLAGRWLLADHAVQLGRYMHTRDLLLRHRHRQICGRVSTARRARPPRRSPSSRQRTMHFQYQTCFTSSRLLCSPTLSCWTPGWPSAGSGKAAASMTTSTPSHSS